MVLSPLLTCLVAFLYVQSFSFGAPLLSKDEVKTLEEIAAKIGKTNWNFSVDPCSGEWGWRTTNPVKDFENSVNCSCIFSNNTICHVVSIVLKGQSLQGVLPTEILKLPYLQQIDFTRNYLSGTIPREWGSSNLVLMSLGGNRLSGQIPKEIGNITTLSDFVVGANQLSGALPPELGDFPNLKRMLLSSNNFSGEIPKTFARLTTLKDIRLDDNHFTGKIPNFIQNLTLLEKFFCMASGLDGPIPSGIAKLENMTDLRITDLNGAETSTFPNITNMKKLIALILRSCKIGGNLPDFLGEMTTLTILIDLSFNKLEGTIPSSYSNLVKANYIYLTGNYLSGKVPNWILEDGGAIDLSYNNFTTEEPSQNCQVRDINLFGSSSNYNNSGLVSCLKSFRCRRNFYSFHINCGGKEVTVGDITYEEDIDAAGPSNFYQSKTNWAFSSTGQFLFDDRITENYIATNKSRILSSASQLYTEARLSPLSLIYYGLCLGNGNYTVNLHFAEIMFTDDQTFQSLGRRVFDVYIQRVLVEKDFNIADEATGPGKEIIRRYPGIVVTSNSLEIQFKWAGRGTTGLPVRGTYGPLISAISVSSDFIPPSENKSSLSALQVSGIVTAVVAAIASLAAILWWKGCRRKHILENDNLKRVDLQTGSFTLRQIKAATNNFHASNKIGEGGFGPVYKGLLLDGTKIAVKQLSSKSKQGNREFVNEIGIISAVQHPHLVKLYGCCTQGNQLLLVYEYMENNNLARALFDPEKSKLMLDWATRLKICVGVARGLAFLHEESRLKIVHRDIKATNVLLDTNLEAKISDFGLAKLDEEDNTHISTRIAGTYGYMAPEYAMYGHLTDKADVYSFGILALEIVSGRSNKNYKSKNNQFYLLDKALVLQQHGRLLELVDPKLKDDYIENEAVVMIKVALLCTNISPAIRPSMSSVVRMLEGKTNVEEMVVSDSSLSYDEMIITRTEIQYPHNEERSLIHSEIQSGSSFNVSSLNVSSFNVSPLNVSSA